MAEPTSKFQAFEPDFLRRQRTGPQAESMQDWAKRVVPVVLKEAWDEAANQTVSRVWETRKQEDREEWTGPHYEPAHPDFEGPHGSDVGFSTPGRLMDDIMRNMIMGLVSGVLGTIFRCLYSLIYRRVSPSSA